MTQPKVSIIIPVYNSAKYFEGTLNTILNQTLDDIEVVIVDDCSTDNSREIIGRQSDNRIKKIFHDNNKGVHSARRNGVLASTGRYIMFADNDDEFYSYTCERAYKAITEHGADIVGFSISINGCGGKKEKSYKRQEKASVPFLGELRNNLLDTYCNSSDLTHNLWTKIYNGEMCRKAWKELEDVRVEFNEDAYESFAMFAFSESYFGIKDALYIYNSGRGLTGRANMNLSSFERMTEGYYTGELIAKFIRNQKMYNYENAVSIIQTRLLKYCVLQWTFFLEESSKVEGLKAMTEKWGVDAVYGALASRIDIMGEKNEKLQEQLQSIKNSNSYHIGRALTKPIRVIKGTK